MTKAEIATLKEAIEVLEGQKFGPGSLIENALDCLREIVGEPI